MSLRKRLSRAPALIGIVGGLTTAYLRLCLRTTRWERRGEDELRTALAQGPVLVVLRHSRLMMAPLHWPKDVSDLSTLHDTSPIALVVGDTHKRIGLAPMAMSRRSSNLVMSRAVLKRLRLGISIGLTADGPLGPAEGINDPPLDWARITGRPVFFYAYSVDRQRRANSWDRLLLPRPWARGAVVFHRWDGTVPRKAEGPERETARTEMKAGLDAVTAEADAMVGLPPGP